MITTINQRLGRLTMYRTMTLTLGALAVIALILSVFKVLSFTPASLGLSLAVLVIVSLVANRIFAVLFSVVPHTESALISALILFFVLQPATDLVTTLQIGLGALFAMASKYLIAVRGRHLVNPAAAGAVWLAIFGMPLALWWVGTPVLLGFVVVGAGVIVLRTRRFAVVGVFLLVAVVGLTLRSLAHQDLGAALGFAVAQSPIIFLAGFMLTEPLTLPPAKWQQLLVAAVIGLLVAVPLQFPGFAVGPETAIVVGNLVAFGFGQRRAVELVLTGRHRLADGVVEYAFAPRRPVRFQAGQAVELDVPHSKPDSRGRRRVFTIASAPQATDLRIGIRLPDKPSTFKSALERAEIGDTVRATGVSGDFVLPKATAQPVVLIAGGIGITPFLSQLRSGVDGRDVVLVWASSEEPAPQYLRDLEESGATVVVVGGSGADTAGVTRVTGRLDEKLLSDLVPDIRTRTAYVSGPPGLVDALGTAARRLGARVRTDYFTGY